MTRLLRPFELDPFDLLWKNLTETNSHFAAITQKVTHPVDIFETQDGILFEVAAVGLDQEDIEILVEGDQLRIKYDKVKPFNQEAAIYRGIKRSGFDLSWKISPKFDLTQLTASLDKGLLMLNVPVAENRTAARKVEIFTPKTIEDKKKK
jgi:HSP20 family molecular chaperone IbpA